MGTLLRFSFVLCFGLMFVLTFAIVANVIERQLVF
jgi:hypothetical protein